MSFLDSLQIDSPGDVVGYAVLGPVYYFLPGTYNGAPSSGPGSSGSSPSSAPPADGCDRSTALGRLGVCEASHWLDSIGSVISSPAVTLAAGGTFVFVGTLAALALINNTGAGDVLRAGGQATAKGLRSAGKLL